MSMGHCCIIAPYGCLWGWEKVLVGGTEAGFFFLEFLLMCHLHLSMEVSFGIRSGHQGY